MTADELPPVGSLVRIHADADGSGSLAPGVLARVTGHTTGSYGLVPMILVEPVGGPSDAMQAIKLDRLDLYRDEYDPLPIDALERAVGK